ncbi:hypothetical protein N0V94_008604 [Neodidymelliopsis sp. IMI 364377]|nr:hypothetical protein N0V94_008604 [Neodidymelliopsis sp. IMI 364377]
MEPSVHEGAAAITKAKAIKRKTPSSPVPSPGEKHRNKRRAPTMQQLFEEDVGRKYDPLGQDAYVPATVKKEAVSHWLHDQQRNRISGDRTRDSAQTYSVVPSQAVSTFASQASQQPYQYVDPLHTIHRAVPPSTYVQQARLGYNRPTTGHEMNMQYAPRPWNQQSGGVQMISSSAFPNMPDLASYSDRMASAEEASRHLDYLYHSIKATRKQAQARNAAMDEQYRVRHGKAPPAPFGMSGSLNQPQGFNMAWAPGRHMDIATPQSLAALNLTLPPDSIMTLRIHSNTFDINGQPIFSLLRMRRNEKFGPRLNAYCVNRGKEFGEEWMFVYRYLAAIPSNPQQYLQITLSWDMTPQDVKDEDFPGTFINHLDTIFVMVAKPLPTAFTFDLTGENDGVRSPGPQIPRNCVDIVPGETKLYQNDNIARQWYLAVEHDAARMRGMYGALKSTILRQNQQLDEQDKTIKKLQDSLSQATTLSSRLGGRMQDPCAAEPAVVPGDRIIRQRVEYPRSRPRVNLPQQRGPSTFVTKCEAVRDPEAQTLQSLQPLRFPTYADQQALSAAERRAQFDAFVREGERDIAEAKAEAEAEAEMLDDTVADTVEDTVADTEEEEDDIKMEEEE